MLIEANIEQIQDQINKVLPTINNMMSKVEQFTGQSTKNIEKNMDFEKGTNRIVDQLAKLNTKFEQQMNKMEKASEQSSANVGKNMSKGFTQAKSKVGKDVDAIVNEINAKMGQAKAQQEKLAFLRSKRQGADSSGDTGSVVKYDEQIARAQAAMTKYQDSAKALANSIQSEFKTIPKTLDDITSKMDANEGQIESYRSKIKALQAEYNNQKTPIGNFNDGFKGAKDNKASLNTSDAIQKQSEKMNKLINENDKLQQAFAQAEDRAQALKSVLGGVNTELGETSLRTNTAANGLKKMARNTDQSKSFFSRFGGLFNRVSNSISHGTRRMTNGFGKIGSVFQRNSNQVHRGSQRMTNGLGGFNRRLSSMVKQVFVFGLIYKGLSLVSKGLFSALQTNDQFSASLNQIKVNLLTAFYPIYTAILPAINALMSAIAEVTGYLAQFIAMLFGTTYSAAKQGAQGLQENIEAMNDTGTAADKTREKVKKLERSLMGFDEINKIGLSDDNSDEDLDIPLVNKPKQSGNGTNFDVPEPATPKWLTDFADKFKKVLADLFEPIKAAWDKHGQKVIDAWKYALNNVWSLIKSIGKSFMDVWTNGSGERFVSNILILLADVLNIIGDIAKAFNNAWNDGGRGTALIQSIFNMWNAILELLHEVAVAFRDAWNSGVGEAIIANILEILTNVNNTIAEIAKRFTEAWTNAGTGEGIIRTILEIVNIILNSLNDMSRATLEWAQTLDFTPLLKSIQGLLESIKPLTKNIGDDLAWFYKNVLLPLASFTITKLIPNFLDALSAAIKVVNSVVDALKPFGQWLFDNFLKPLGKITGFAVIGVLKTLTAALTGVSDWISNNQEAFRTITKVIGGFFLAWEGMQIASFIQQSGGLVTVLSKIATGVKSVTTAKLADKAETIALNALYAKDFVVSIAKGTAELAKQAVKFGVNTAAKAADALAQGAMTVATTAWNVVAGIATGVTTAFGAAVAFLTSPIGIAIAAIAAIIAIGVALYKNWDTVKEKAGQLGKWLGEKWDGIKEWTVNVFNSIIEFFKEWGAEIVGGLLLGPIGILGVEIVKHWDEIKEWTSEKWNAIKETMGNAVDGAVTWVSDKWGALKQGTSEAWENIKSSTSEKWSAVKETVSKKAQEISATASEKWKKVKSDTSEAWENVKKTSTDKWNQTKDAIGGKTQEILTATSDRWGQVKSSTSNAWDNVKTNVSNAASKAKDGAVAAWNKMSSGIGEWMGNIKNTSQSGFDTVVGWASGLGKKIADGIKGGASAIAGAAKSIANSIVGIIGGAVNGVIKGINWVLAKVGSGWSITEWSVPRFKNGTDYHMGGPALINDAPGSVFREAVRLPNGEEFIPTGRNVMLNLPKGTKVLNAQKTAQTYGNIPQYKDGIGDWFEEKWNSIKNAASGMLSSAVASFTNLSGVLEPTLSIATGGISMMTQGAFSFVQKKIEQQERIDRIKERIRAMREKANNRRKENGGLVTEDGLYRLSEGNKTEMVLPLEKPTIAMPLIGQALDFMGIDSSFSSLQLPEIFRTETGSFNSSNSYESQQNDFVGGGLNQITDAIVRAITTAMQSGNGRQNNSQPVELIINLGGSEYARHLISEINEYQEKTGKNELMI
ncbi:phage tail protein [Enterococcus caccae]